MTQMTQFLYSPTCARDFYFYGKFVICVICVIQRTRRTLDHPPTCGRRP